MVGRPTMRLITRISYNLVDELANSLLYIYKYGISGTTWYYQDAEVYVTFINLDRS